MNLPALTILTLCLSLSSCAFQPSSTTQAPLKFVNESFCTVQLAFKARLLKTPDYRIPGNTVCKLEKDELLQVVGLEKGMAKVRNEAGFTGYISDRYFKTNLFYDAWKSGYYARLHDRERIEKTFTATQE